MTTETSPQPRLHLSLTSEPGSVRQAADALRQVLTLLGCGITAVAEIELCAVEAMNNVIEHAYSGHPGRPFELTGWMERGGFVLELRDEGSSLPPEAMDGLSLPTVDPEQVQSLPEGGWGLYIMRELMDEVSYASHSGGNVLRLVRRRQLTEST